MSTRRRSDRGLSSVVSIRSRSSLRMSARSSRDMSPVSISRRLLWRSSMRPDMPRSSFTSGCTRRVRRLNSSTSISDLPRLRRNRIRASRAASGDVLRLISRRKLVLSCSIRCSSVCRLWGIRDWICSFVSRSVSETLIVRSNGSFPSWTPRSVSTVACSEYEQPRMARRNRLRVTSILLASEISSARVSSGISAICARYIRIGSLPAFDGAVVIASSRRGCAGRGLAAGAVVTAICSPGSGGVSTSSIPCSSSATRRQSIFSGSTASSGR